MFAIEFHAPDKFRPAGSIWFYEFDAGMPEEGWTLYMVDRRNSTWQAIAPIMGLSSKKWDFVETDSPSAIDAIIRCLEGKCSISDFLEYWVPFVDVSAFYWELF